ncbi:MAG: PQQ-binding-like beta-propeller repeat protein [Planctomycetes bacterium]|nr:PQQ-binding-like beta-propeller repeat protein [Planctomycetota bacterium]
MACIVLLATLAGVDAWSGFHGLERQGLAGATAPPARWSPDENVVWRTPIPGSGLSSPVVADGRIYLTSSRDSLGYASMRKALDVASLILLCAIVTLGAGSFVRPAGWGRRGGWHRLGAGAALAFLIASAAGTVLLADSIAGWSDSVVRAWFVSVGLLGMCILIGALASSPRSGAWLFLGIVALALAAPVYLALPEKDWILRFSGRRGIAIQLGLASLPILGVLLVLGRWIARQRAPQGAEPEPVPARVLAFLLIASALALGIPHFVALNFLLRDRVIVRAVACIDGETGAILWDHEDLEGKGETLHPANSHATPTPVWDEGCVYAYFGTAGMIALDAEGNPRWTNRELPFESPFGAAASPVARDGLIIVVSDGKPGPGGKASAPSYIAAIDAATGRRAWRTERPAVEDADATYATPIVRRIGGRDQVIAQGWEDVRGYDAATGEERWIQPLRHGGLHLIAGIASDERRLYVSTGRGVTAFDIAKLGGGDAVAWSQESRRLRGEKSATPVVADGLLFTVTEKGLAVCLDAETGDIAWEHDIDGRCFASVLAAGGYVYFTNEAGVTSVVERGREFRLVATNALGEGVRASIAPFGNRLLIRSADALYAIGPR